MRGLIDIAKTVTAERDKYKTDFDYLVQGVEATGTTPQQYGEALSWLALFNSRDPAQQEKALELVENVAERLATLLGKDRTVGDPLAAHADLKEAVTKGQITQQYAKEIARTRNGQTFRTELQTAASTEAQAAAAKAEELSTARQSLTELEQTLRDSDPAVRGQESGARAGIAAGIRHHPAQSVGSEMERSVSQYQSRGACGDEAGCA